MDTRREQITGVTKAEKIVAALRDGVKRRAELLEITDGSTQALHRILQRLVARRKIVRLYPGVYALRDTKEA